MTDEQVQHYYTVGVHGPPTKETAPHGARWRHSNETRWRLISSPEVWHWTDPDHWQPLPAPPTEQAPPPEPVARWTACNLGCGWSSLRCGPDLNHPSHEDARAAADALNAFDRDGVAWGPGRPMSELPDGHRKRVLLVDPSGHTWIDSGTHRGFDEKAMRAGWWPLPLPGEAQ